MSVNAVMPKTLSYDRSRRRFRLLYLRRLRRIETLFFQRFRASWLIKTQNWPIFNKSCLNLYPLLPFLHFVYSLCRLLLREQIKCINTQIYTLLLMVHAKHEMILRLNSTQSMLSQALKGTALGGIKMTNPQLDACVNKRVEAYRP